MQVEGLEERLAPATDTWTGGGTLFTWNDPSNWTAGVPTSSSQVVIPAGQTVQSPASATTISSLSLNGTLDLQANLTLNTTSTIGAAGTLSALASSRR